MEPGKVEGYSKLTLENQFKATQFLKELEKANEKQLREISAELIVHTLYLTQTYNSILKSWLINPDALPSGCGQLPDPNSSQLSDS